MVHPSEVKSTSGASRAPPTPSRRGFLGALSVPLAAGSLGAGPVVGLSDGRPPRRDGDPSGRSHARDAAPDTAFDPGLHGFGFHNWSTTVPTYPEHAHDAVTEDQVRRSLLRRWRGPLQRSLDLDVSRLPSALLDVVARQVYVAVNQRSATNGHCYGMVFASQEYYETPDAIPLGREHASEFTHPSEPLDDRDVAPVSRDVDRFQNSQFLDFYAWAGRRALLRPGWIDYRRQLDGLRDVIDTFGTAGVTLLNTRDRTSHQVLLYDYRTTSDGVSFATYDPNRPAHRYRTSDDGPTIHVDTSGPSPSVEPYGTPGYDAFVYNRYDRTIAARQSAEPLDRIDRTDEQIRDLLFTVAVFLLDADLDLTVVGPGGRPVTRIHAPFMDRRHTEYDRMRVRYGADPGRYRVVVGGKKGAEYTLEVLGASLEGELVSTRATAAIDAGEVHEYVAEVPESRESGGSLERLADRGGSVTTNAALAVGAAGFATAAYAVFRGRESGRDADDSATALGRVPWWKRGR